MSSGFALGLVAWRSGMRALAACPNVAVKISGLGMVDRRWTAESIRPFVLETIETFGTGRCLFASNFPVDGMHGSFDDLFSTYDQLTADLEPYMREKLFASNAERVYRC